MRIQPKISLLMRRLRQTSRKEVIFRGRQFAWNRCEAIRYRTGLGPLAEKTWMPDRSAPTPERRFFFSSADMPALINAIRTRLPGAAEETIERAERICSHRFDLLGYRDVDMGKHINWHLDRVHEKEAPRKTFYKVPYLDFETVGDSKVTWELNRHQHFITLGKAYQLTHGDKYLREFTEEFYDWQNQNPYLVGINWASSLEVALRSLSWLWAKELFNVSQVLPARLEQDLLSALGRNARFIEHNLSTFFSPNTHLLGEAVALFFIGVLCPGLRGATGWRALGWQIILREAERQIRADGGYFEQASYYHIYALDLLLHARILAWRNQIPIPEIFDRTLISMSDYLSALSTGGPVPRLGDDDGGRLFDPTRNRAEHLSDPLSTGAALFHRGDWKAASPGLAEETLWLLGPVGAADFDALPNDKPQVVSQALHSSGIYLMAGDGLRIAVDAGPFGRGYCGHAHADALSITLATDGHEWLSDPGTFTYTGSAHWREIFRGTAAHNTLRIDGCDQAELVAPFKWNKIPTVRAEHWWTGKHFDLLIASHDGYHRLSSPATHRRLVFFVKPRFWVVIDSVEGKSSHQLELFWHMPRVPAKLAARALEVGPLEGEKFGLIPLQDSDWSVELVESWRSESYGEKRAALALRCSTQTCLPAEFATLLMPRLAEPMGQFERLIDSACLGQARGFRYCNGSEKHSWVLANGRQTWRLNDIESDARFSYWEEDAEGSPRQAFLWKGSFLSVNGIKVVDLTAPQEHFEKTWLRAEGTTLENNPQEAGALVLGNHERAQ
jgi:hypothetical protein